MSVPNPHFVAALGKLNIPLDGYRTDSSFQTLPSTVVDPLWDEFRKPPYSLTVFELGAMKKVCCATTPARPPPAGESPPRKLRRPIRTVSFEELVVPLSACANIRIENVPGYMVDMDRVKTESMRVINDALRHRTDAAGSFRRDPLVFQSLSRGGKTTVLTTLFDAVKSTGRLAMILCLSSTAGFVRRANEPEEQAILRQMVLQLIDPSAFSPSELDELTCDERVLDDYLDQQTRWGTPEEVDFVLLIDRLNVFGTPLSVAASQMLQRMFLQKNRYLVYSSSVPLYLTTGPFSSPGIRVVPMPHCLDVSELRKMDGCNTLTRHEAMLYGGIPGLIVTVQSNPGFCDYRFDRAMTVFQKLYPETCTDRKVQRNLLKEVIDALLSGIPSDHVALRFFDQFGSAPEAGHIRWPLCYVSAILYALNISEPAGVYGVINEICDLCNRPRPVGPSMTHETGPDWQSVADVAMLLRMLQAVLWNTSHRFLSPVPVTSIGIVRMPDTIRTLEQAQQFIHAIPCRQQGLLLLIRCTYAKFPLFDSFVVATMPSGELYVTGYQVNLGRKTPPRRGVPEWMQGGGVLLRGVDGAPSSSSNSPLEGWTYMSPRDMQSFLGYSLAPLYPSSWVSDVREEDQFD